MLTNTPQRSGTFHRPFEQKGEGFVARVMTRCTGTAKPRSVNCRAVGDLELRKKILLKWEEIKKK